MWYAPCTHTPTHPHTYTNMHTAAVTQSPFPHLPLSPQPHRDGSGLNRRCRGSGAHSLRHGVHVQRCLCLSFCRCRCRCPAPTGVRAGGSASLCRPSGPRRRGARVQQRDLPEAFRPLPLAPALQGVRPRVLQGVPAPHPRWVRGRESARVGGSVTQQQQQRVLRAGSTRAE
jgi:hypothetical protein